MASISKKNPVDLIFSFITAVASFSVIIFIIGILYVLVSESSLAIGKFGILKLLTSTDWNPVTESFGALTNIYGTVITTFLSLLIAIPVAIGIAVFVTEISPSFMKGPIGVAIELLAAIPSIIYGMWGLFTLSPIMSTHVATRVFQALRIAVNRELNNLVKVLAEAPSVLVPGARMCVLTFHSLEDRIVKQAFAGSRDYKVVTRKPVAPGRLEVLKNPRARSAKLRVVERV